MLAAHVEIAPEQKLFEPPGLRSHFWTTDPACLYVTVERNSLLGDFPVRSSVIEAAALQEQKPFENGQQQQYSVTLTQL